jgi:hypothetical protein
MYFDMKNYLKSNLNYTTKQNYLKSNLNHTAKQTHKRTQRPIIYTDIEEQPGITLRFLNINFLYF